MKPLHMWKTQITLRHETPNPPTTRMGTLSSCLCKSEEEDEEEEGSDAVLRAHRNPWDTPSTTPSTSVESSFNTESVPMTWRREDEEANEKKPSIVVLDVEL